MRVAVVILNWNGVEVLKKFLPSVLSNLTTPDCEVIVADNGSTDDSVDWLRENYPDLQLILLDKNYGFADGYNNALSEVKADYFMLLNSDVEWKDDPIQPLLDILDGDATIGIAMPKILSQREPEMFEYAGAAGGFIDYFGFPFCRGRILNSIERDDRQYDSVKDVFWASGAALFIRSELYCQLGGLDGTFFAHMEEIDLCWRAQSAGYRVVCEPKSRVYHVGGASLNSESPFKLYLNFRNSLFMLHKNLVNYKLRVFLRMSIDGVLAVCYLLQGKLSYFKAVIRAHNDYRRSRVELDKSREKIRPKRCKYVYKGSIILGYIIGKNKFSKLKIDE